MSFFARKSPADACAVEDVERNVEVADGVVVERRSLLWLSASAVGAMLTGTATLRAQHRTGQHRMGQHRMGQDAKPETGLSFAQFLEQALPLSRRLVASKGADEEAYLMTVAAAMSRISDPGAPLREAMHQFRQANKQEGERFPLAAMTMKLNPGGGFTHHDHLNYNGVIMGIEGEVRIRNYDFQGAAPASDSTKTFQIRETRNDLILPGRFSSLGSKRENIHDLVAGKNGARVLDVFTFLAKGATSRYLDVEAKPRDAEARVYDATWRQRRGR